MNLPSGPSPKRVGSGCGKRQSFDRIANYVKTHGDLAGLPDGMHSVVPAAPERGLVSGVIFAPRNRNDGVNINRQNRLHPNSWHLS